jgi:hypothetical protein
VASRGDATRISRLDFVAARAFLTEPAAFVAVGMDFFLLGARPLAAILGRGILGDGRAAKGRKSGRDDGSRYPFLHERLSFFR